MPTASTIEVCVCVEVNFFRAMNFSGIDYGLAHASAPTRAWKA